MTCANQPHIRPIEQGPPARVRVLTPMTAGAIAVIQVVGPEAVRLAEGIFRGSGGRSAGQTPPGAVSHGHLVDADGAVLDEVLAWRGQDERGSAWVELQVHGGVRIVQRVVRRLEALGAEPASRGPAGTDGGAQGGEPVPADGGARGGGAFDAAFGWLCRLDRCVQACLARAATGRVVEWLIGQGRIWHEVLGDWDARIVAGDVGGVRRAAEAILAQAHVAAAWQGRTLAIVGMPNAGKSTIANRLAGRGISLVMDQPGTTRDWVGEAAAVRGWPVVLIDTAGLREAADAIEAEGVRRALERARGADLRLLVLDSACPPGPSESLLVAQVGVQSGDVVGYARCDLPAARRCEGGEVMPAHAGHVRFSSLTGEGWTELEEKLLAGLGFAALQEPKPLVFCAELHISVARAVSALADHRVEAARGEISELLASKAWCGTSPKHLTCGYPVVPDGDGPRPQSEPGCR